MQNSEECHASGEWVEERALSLEAKELCDLRHAPSPLLALVSPSVKWGYSYVPASSGKRVRSQFRERLASI